MIRTWQAAALILVVALGAVVAAPAATGPVIPGGRSNRPAVTWVFFRDRPASLLAADPDAVDPAYVAEVRARVDRLRHVTRWLNGVSVEVNPDQLAELARLPFVREVRPVLRGGRRHDLDRPALDPMGVNDPGIGPDTGAGGIDRFVPRLDSGPTPRSPGTGGEVAFAGDEAWHYGASFNQNAQVGIVDLHRLGYTGAGVTVAIFDSGFRTTHVSLSGRHVLAERDFVFGDDDVDNEPEDTPAAWNHGTSVWSNVGGFKPGALVGGAFEAGILLAKTEDVRSETPIEEDNFIAAIEWADGLGADIISASLLYLDFDPGNPDYTYADLDGDTTPLAIAVDMAVARGICMVNAVGNFGPNPGTLWTPADADSVLSVGAVDSLWIVTSFSSRGPTPDGRIKPEVVARGRSNFVAFAAGGFGASSGTSFATPVTAGAAALLKEAHPSWTGWQLREALRSTASHPGTPDNNTGWGLVRLVNAAGLSASSLPRVSRPFSLEFPDRGSVINSAAPVFRWRRSIGNPGDVVTYRVALATTPTFAGADTFPAGLDSTWIPSMFLVPGTTYYWQVVATNLAGWKREALRPGSFTVAASVGVAERESGEPGPFLAAPAPNPFTGVTRLSMMLPPGEWSVDVIGVDGRLVRRLARGTSEGIRSPQLLAWDGRTDDGMEAVAGIYFVRLLTPAGTSSRRVVLERN
ncbi:MAG TPA: S8 family peptidase [Candidatus Eisenbacteria bacterium]